MKILFVHQRLGALGGAEANIRITANELGLRGHELSLLYGEGTGRNEQGYRALFDRCERLPRDSSNLRLLIEDCAPDLIYLHNLADLSSMEAIFDFGVPVVRMVHDHSLYCLRGYKYNPLTRKPCTRSASGFCVFPCGAVLARNRNGLLPFKWASYAARQRDLELTRKCAALVAYSDFSKRELVANGFDPWKIHIHVPMECGQGRHRLSNFSDRNLILFAGQIIRGKGVDLLLRALRKIRLPFECILAGDGSHRSHCERLTAKLGLSSKVRFTGYLPPAELENLYLDASVFVFPSVWPEPFGMAGPEAMRFGLPVVGFDAGAVREWLIDGENGFLAPWGDTAILAARIEQLLEDKPLAQRLGRNGRDRVTCEYAATGQIDGLEQLFAQTVGTIEPSPELPIAAIDDPLTSSGCLPEISISQSL